MPDRSRWFWVADVCALVTFAFIAWLAGGFLLRSDVFVYGDHPAHYWKFWYTLNVGLPLHHRLFDWNPYWYAGYPDMQFYPPGFVLLGLLFNLFSLGTLSTALIYQLVTFIAFILPGFTFYYAFRHLGFGRPAAFAAGILGLVFPQIDGGARGTFIGMIGARLAFGLNPLVLVWGIDYLQAPGTQSAGRAIGALALGILAHTYHEIGIVLALGLYILARRLPLFHAGVRLFILVISAVALDAFWLAPLLAHTFTEMIPLIRATLDQVWRNLIDEALVPYALFALLAIVRVRRETDSTRRAFVIVLFVLVPLLGALMLADYVILVERLAIYSLDPIRIIGEYYFALVMLAAIGIAEFGDWISNLPWLVLAKRFAPVLAVPLICLFFVVQFFQANSFFLPREDNIPRFIGKTITDYHLDEFYSVLRATEGRVLFTSYYTYLQANRYDTTLAALTPLYTNRQLIGGTYSYWSPVAALTWTGRSNPPVLRGRAEELDDRALFGKALEDLSDDELFDYCKRLNITTVVSSVNDYRTRTFLDGSRHFQSYYNNELFFAYRVREYENAWIEARDATVNVISFEDDQMNLKVLVAQSGASVVVKVYAYPLWRAYLDDGRVLTIARDDFGMMSIALPRGENYSVTLRYEEGIPERGGTILSLLSLVGLGLVSLRGMDALTFWRHSRGKTNPL